MPETAETFDLPILAEIGAQLHSAALAASRGRRPLASRRRWVSRRVGAVALAIGVVATPAIAATELWQPILGRPSLHNAPTSTSTTTPEDTELAVLGVLRRSQSNADRGPAVAALLGNLSSEQAGVRPESVRLLDGTSGQEAALVSVASIDDGAAGVPAHVEELCLLFGQGSTCGDLEQLLTGRLFATAGPRQLGLVPDGVAQVVLHYANGQELVAAVHDNFLAPRRFTWVEPY
jgi:hypothetical protein